MIIGNVKIEGFAALAPMAGVADLSFRVICKEFGAAYTVGEMVSAKGVSMNDKKSQELMKLDENEHPSAIQIFGNKPEIMAEAARYALSFSPDIIDINMGCPAPKIIKNKSGSFLMKDPVLAGKITKAVSDAVDIPVSVKFRTGWDDSSKNCVEFAKTVEANGASFITVHGRTKEQMYAPPVDIASIKAVKEAVSVPVIGNGDIFTPEGAKNMYERTGVDLVMIGRGALGRPWLFSQINDYMNTGSYNPEPSPEERMEIMLRHADAICQLRGVHNGMCEIRKHALWYTKGLRGSAKLRSEFSVVKTYEELKALAEKVTEIKE
ncbi:MAG: tRNA dihydrouridine synthase DusB [Clostridia bacterium]|nr:tRNA dihydrouridine synthase DusB [Clostridia bacterium]